MKHNHWLAVVFLVFLGACSSQNEQNLQFQDRGRPVPAFHADSAYSYLSRQVQFGPRNPGSEAHRQAQAYFINRLKEYAGNKYVFSQQFSHRGYEGDTLQMANIIAAFNPGSSDRIMLCAHWDSRPRADQDSVNTDNAILGADDGASGAAVLLEIARLFKQKQPPVGVDIVLFDGEDYGREGDYAQYFLGSRFWSNYPPVKNYNPRFAILLDMVGGAGARFPKEGYSTDFAPGLMNEIWAIAEQKGHEALFVDQQGARISDDHVVINRIRKIPTVDIIRHSTGEQGEVNFPPYWHTHRDNMDVIDKNTLKAVGEVLTELVYNRI